MTFPTPGNLLAEGPFRSSLTRTAAIALSAAYAIGALGCAGAALARRVGRGYGAAAPRTCRGIKGTSLSRSFRDTRAVILSISGAAFLVGSYPKGTTKNLTLIAAATGNSYQAVMYTAPALSKI